MLTETAANILADARRLADVETSTPTTDYDTDVELLRYLNDAYRELVDLIVKCGGGDLLLTHADLASPYNVPADFYRAKALSLEAGTTDERDLRRFVFRERHQYTDSDFPAWRIMGASPTLRFYPTDAAPTSVRLWYIPTATSIGAGDTVSTFGGWDMYLKVRIAQRILANTERENPALGNELAIAIQRVRAACADLSVGEPERIPDVHRVPADYDDFGWEV